MTTLHRLGAAMLLMAAAMTPRAQTAAAPTPASANAPTTPSATPRPSPTPTGPVILRVNGEEVRQSQYDELVNAIMSRQLQQMAMFGQQGINPEMINQMREAIRADAKEQLISMTLFNQAVEKQVPNVQESLLKARLDEIEAQLKGEGRTLESVARSQQLTMDAIRNDVRRGAAVEMLFTANGIKFEPTDQEIKTFYDEHKAEIDRPERMRTSHILIGYPESAGDPRSPDFKPDPKVKEEMRKKAEEVWAKVRAGEDFAALARQYSTCPSAAEGGDLSFNERGSMVAAFDAAAWALKNDGDTTGVVESPFGFHIIKRTGMQGPQGFEEQKAALRVFLREQGIRQNLSALVEKLRKDAKVEDLMPASAAPTPATPTPAR